MRSGIWNGSISFGLINIPVSVQGAEKDKELHFNLLDKRNLAPIKYHRTNGKTGKEVPNNQIVKGYQYEKGKYVLMSDQDFKRANPKATELIDIQSFVKLADIDLLFFERPYYLAPQKGGEKAYFLLQQALTKSGKVAIAKIVMHTKEHLTCIFPRGKYLVLEMMRFAHAIKEVKEVPALHSKSSPQFSAKELKMAETLIQDMTSKWEPEQYKDTYYDDLMKHIQARVKSGKVEEIETGDGSKSETPVKASKSTDLMALLKQSLGHTTTAVKAKGKRKSAHSSLH